MVLLECLSPLSATQFMVAPQLPEVPHLELKYLVLVEFEAPSQESTAPLYLHQILHRFTQLSFRGMTSTHSSFEELLCNPQIPPIMFSTLTYSLILRRHGSKTEAPKILKYDTSNFLLEKASFGVIMPKIS